MEALRCDYCGGHINPNTYKCEYCGTQYKKPQNDSWLKYEVKFVSASAPCEVLGVQKEIDMFDFRTMQDIGVPIEAKVREDFANQIARAIADKLTIYEDYDITSMKKKYMAKLRIVKPDYRF